MMPNQQRRKEENERNENDELLLPNPSYIIIFVSVSS